MPNEQQRGSDRQTAESQIADLQSVSGVVEPGRDADMLVVAFKPGHDGAVAVVEDGELTLLVEAEKDSFPRHSALTPTTFFEVAERLGRIPDVFALGGWQTDEKPIGAGYHGVDAPMRTQRRYFGKDVEYFSSSHVRSHIMMALGMAPRLDPPSIRWSWCGRASPAASTS